MVILVFQSQLLQNPTFNDFMFFLVCLTSVNLYMVPILIVFSPQTIFQSERRHVAIQNRSELENLQRDTQVALYFKISSLQSHEEDESNSDTAVGGYLGLNQLVIHNQQRSNFGKQSKDISTESLSANDYHNQDLRLSYLNQSIGGQKMVHTESQSDKAKSQLFARDEVYQALAR